MLRRRYRHCLVFRLTSVLFCISLTFCLLILICILQFILSSSKNDAIIRTNLKFSRKMNLTDKPKEAFVTFTNRNYYKLLKVLLDSVHTFSSRPIIIYAIDFYLDIDLNQYPQVIVRNISQEDCGSHAYYCKLHAVISSELDYGVLLEADDIVNYNIDVLFDLLHVWPYDYPLSPRHTGDPVDYKSFMKKYSITKQTTPYIHAHIIWNFRALPFLHHVKSMLEENDFQKANYDETALNIMLWKVKASHTLCTYDPHFPSIKFYERWPLIRSCLENCHSVFLTLHGCKDPDTASHLLNRLKANVGKPVIQTPGMNGMKHLNDNTATCCYPDSKPSSIHPLLCEHKILN